MAGGGRPDDAPGQRSDLELVEAGLAGDRRALDALLRRHAPMVHGLCRRISASDADADDATQEALIAIVRGLPRFDGRSRFSTWVYRVATNACLDEVRRRRRRPAPADPADMEAGLDIDPAAAPGRAGPGGAGTGGPGAGAAAGAGLDAAVADRLDVDAALRRLPVEFRAAVVLRDLCTLEYAEIADVLGVPVGTVRSRIARGRAALVPLLAGPGRPAGRAGNSAAPPGRPTERP